MTGAANRIEVDPDGLDALGVRIGRVVVELQSSLGLFDGQGSDIGSTLIEGALNDFNNAWSQRRNDLITLLQDSEAVLHNAANEFRQADSGLASAIDGSNAPSGTA